MKLWLYLALLGTAFVAGDDKGSDVAGEISETKVCADGLFNLECSFEVSYKDFRRRRLGGSDEDRVSLRGLKKDEPRNGGEGVSYPTDVFSDIVVKQDGMEVEFTQTPVAETIYSGSTDEVLGDDWKLQTYVTVVQVLDGPKAELLFKVRRSKNSNGVYVNSYNDFKIAWSDC